jgi:hypothetical protein
MDVCFVLDTTGSMGGLIEGAKQKIWSIANDMVSAKPTPELRLGLIAYRDRGDAYITKRYELTDDIDVVYDNLTKFKAAGGGDGPESVNQALHEAVTAMSWSEDRKTLKIIFLVGDAPPHMDYKDDVKYPDVCQAAVKKDLIINTIQCGSMGGTKDIWQDIANKAEGKYVAIAQSGGVNVIATPMDAEVADLSAKLAGTRMGYGGGDAPFREKAKAAREAAEDAPAPTAAARGTYMGKAAALDELPEGISEADKAAFAKRVKDGEFELVDALEKKVVTLSDLKEEELPEVLRKLEPGAREGFVAERMAERKKLEARLGELSKRRADFIAAKKKELAAAGKKDGFDDEVFRMVREQAAKKGITYEETE